LGLSDLTIVNPRQNVDEALKDEQLTGTVKLSWFPVEDLMLFASFGTGYKSGGTNTDRINPVFDVIFDAETSETFEVGVKADIPSRDLRVNLTLHHTTTENYQTNAFQGNGFNLSNAGEVEARGGELEVWWSPTATFDTNFSYVYNKAEFKGFERANCWIAYSWLTGIQDPGRQLPTDQFCDRSGGPLDTNPEHSFIVGATKVFAVAQGREIFVHGDYVYRDEQYMDSNLDPFKVQDGYGLVNARAGFRLLAEGVELAFWGRNLFDKDYLNVHFDVPLQFGKLNAYTGEPRTYGATLRVEF
jgi:outer membrane receptor protein involved in Fe transport